MLIVALVDIRIWFRSAYWIYAVALVLVIAVDLRGFVGMGAQRWIDLGVIQLQPSEIMKIALVLALARYFHGVPRRECRPDLAADPAGDDGLSRSALVLKQPDLGTAMLLLRLGRDPVLPRRRAAADVRLAAVSAGVRGPDRLAIPARLPEDPSLYLPRPGAGPARAPATTSPSRRSRSAPGACSARASCSGRRPI